MPAPECCHQRLSRLMRGGSPAASREAVRLSGARWVRARFEPLPITYLRGRGVTCLGWRGGPSALRVLGLFSTLPTGKIAYQLTPRLVAPARQAPRQHDQRGPTHSHTRGGARLHKHMHKYCCTVYLALATTGVDSDSRHRVRRPEPNSFEGGGHTHTLSLTQSHCTLSVSDSLLGSTHSLMSSPFPSTLVEKCSWSKSTAAAVDDSSLQLDRRLGGELCTDESPTP